MTKSAKTQERILLDKLYAFLLGRNFVQGMPDMLRDMVKRYRQPPLTMHYRVGMQMTVPEYDHFFDLITELHEYMMAQESPKQVDELIGEPVYARNVETGTLDRIGIVRDDPV